MLDKRTILTLIHTLAEKSQPHFFEVHTLITKYDESHEIIKKPHDHIFPNSHKTIYDHNMGRDEAQLIADLLNLGIGKSTGGAGWAEIEPFVNALIEQPTQENNELMDIPVRHIKDLRDKAMRLSKDARQLESDIRDLIGQPAPPQTPPDRTEEMIALLHRSETMLANTSSSLKVRNQLTEEQIRFVVSEAHALRTEIISFLDSIRQEK